MDEAARIRREAEEYADAARRRADAFAEARIRRIRELSDRLIATAETVDRRFGEALAIKEQLDDLVAALNSQSFPLHGLQVSAASDEGDVRSALGEQRAEVPADRTSAHDGHPHGAEAIGRTALRLGGVVSGGQGRRPQAATRSQAR